MIDNFINYIRSIEEEEEKLNVYYWNNFLREQDGLTIYAIFLSPLLSLLLAAIFSLSFLEMLLALLSILGVFAISRLFVSNKAKRAKEIYEAIIQHKDQQLEKFLTNEKNELGDIEKISNPILFVLKINNLQPYITEKFENIEKIKDYLITNNLTLDNTIEVGIDRKIRLTISDLQEILDSDIMLYDIRKLIDIKKITNYTNKLNFSKKIGEISGSDYRPLYLKIIKERLLSVMSIQEDSAFIVDIPELEMSLSEEQVKQLFTSNIEVKIILDILGEDNIHKLKDYLPLLIRSDKIEELKSDKDISRDFLFYIKGKSLNVVQMQLMRELLPEHQYRIFRNNNTKKFSSFYSVEEFLIYWGNYKETIDMPEHAKSLLDDIIREEVSRLNEFKQVNNPLPEYQEQIVSCENAILEKINKLVSNQEEVKHLTASK